MWASPPPAFGLFVTSPLLDLIKIRERPARQHVLQRPANRPPTDIRPDPAIPPILVLAAVVVEPGCVKQAARKVTLATPVSSDVVQKLPKGCRAIAPGAETQPEFHQ